MLIANDKVSVIIPIYNSEFFLRDSLESVLCQTYSNTEIICIDDGSTDKSPDILKQYSDKVTIITQKNQGLASALNIGINEMTGKWFKWFSPDDIMYPQAIEILVKKANELGENYIIYSNWKIIDENNHHLRNFSESNYNDLNEFDFNVRLLDGQQINVNTSLIPSWLFKKGCTFQKLKDPILIDYDFFLRAGILFGIGFYLIPKNLIKYRVHMNQLSHKNILNSLSNLNEIKDDVLLKLDNQLSNSYSESFKKYDDGKSISKKSINLSLKFMKKILPDKISDQILTLYLNKIRRSR